MKILVPLSKQEYIDPYIQAGADELYFGFFDETWSSTFGKYADINRMSGFGRTANPYSFEQIIPMIEQIKGRGKKAFVTLNANGYSKEQIQFMEQHYFPSLRNADLDGVIMSDVNAMIAAQAAGLRPVASTMCAIYNSDIARMYQELGVRRMILPRDLSLAELETICSRLPDVQFEAFFMRNGCIFSDSYCLGLHRPECGATCTYTRYNIHQYHHDYSSFEDSHDVDVNDYLYRTAFLLDACAMCALYRLKNIGVTSLKVVGRSDDFENVCRDIVLTRKNIDIMERARSEKEYLETMIFPHNHPQRCRMGMSCYYPEIRFNNQ